MKQFLNKRRIDQIMIPAGMSSYLQSLDLVINKPFKDYLRIEVNDYIEHRMERNQRGNFIKPNLTEIVNWVNNSWNKITANCVTNALRAGYLDRKCSFDGSYIAKHEKFGPRILEEINLQEIQSGIRDLMSYDDVPEEDEMIVLE